MPMPRIFFSYRVVDENDFVFRIYDRFVDHYGNDNVFISPDKIPDGAIWAERILVELERSNVIVAVIGPKWGDLLDEKTNSTEEDFVVKEIEYGLNNAELLVPIRLKNAPMPSEENLPETIKGLQSIQFGEPVNADGTFRESVEKRIQYIDNEMTRRGFVWGNLQLESILSLPLRDLKLHILNEISAGRSTSVTLLMRDFLPYIQSLGQQSGDELQGQFEATIDRLFVFGAAFVLDGQVELHEQFLECIRDIYDYISERGDHPAKTNQILLSLGNSWYIHGAIILREKRYSWLHEFQTHPMRREPYYGESSQWFYNLETHVAEGHLLNKYGFIMTAHTCVKNSQYHQQQFTSDENRALDFLCQLNFSRVLMDCITDATFKSHPSFFRYYHERTMPLVTRLLKEPDFRATLLGSTIDDENFHGCMEHLLMYTCQRSGYIGFWDGSLSSINPSDVKRILEDFQPG